jgi:L-histidine N-alpha-methyltransferase
VRNFDVGEFEHSANYDKEKGRVVIELVSQTDQTFEIADTAFDIADGEAILTEFSHKYTLNGFETMANEAGFNVEEVWTDVEQLFSVQFLTRS